MLRRGLDWRDVPSIHYTGFKFYSTTANFDEVPKCSEYVSRFRLARWEIHNHALDNFRKDVVAPLFARGAKHDIIRELVDKRRIEIHRITCDKVCILLTLRNWSNNLHDVEIARIVKALEKCARRLRAKYERVWKYILAPSFEKGQTRLERFHGIQLYDGLPYILPRSLLTWLGEKCKVDYSYAYPSQERWPSGLSELFCDTLGRLLGLRVRTAALASVNSLRSTSTCPAKTHTKYIDPITTAAPPSPAKTIVLGPRPPSACARVSRPPIDERRRENVSVTNPFFPLVSPSTTPSRPTLNLDSAPEPTLPSSTDERRRRRINFLFAYALEHRVGEKYLTHHAMQLWSVQRRTAKEYAQLALAKLRRLDEEDTLQ